MSPLNLPELIGLAATLGFASGIRLYLVVLAVGLAGHFGLVPLPSGLHVLQHPIIIGAAGLMATLEFLADKIPAVDSLWDAVHTFIRIPAGAALAAAVIGSWTGADAASVQAGVQATVQAGAEAGLHVGAAGGANSVVWTALAALLGGGLAATGHIAKSSTRAAVNTSPEPFSNIAVSSAEDIATGGLLWLAWANPWLAGGVVLVLTLLALWLTVKLWRVFRAVLARLGGRPRLAAPRP